MNQKGFTLIELLAVIVILAIIAVIATPMILNTIDDARKGAAKSSAYSYIDAVETEVAKYILDNNGTSYSAGKYDISKLSTDLGVEVKGDAPSAGNICIGSNGVVTKASLKINNYVVSYDGKETTTTDLDEVEDITCDGTSGEVALVGDPILDKAKALVYDENGTCKTDDTTYTYMGGCYIKGASTSNYVWYNGFMWRIMGINSDNTVRLITDENVTALAYGASNTGLTYTTNEGYIHDWLNEYFYNSLNSTKSIIQEGAYFCSETTNSTSLTEGRTECTSGSEVTTKVGLIALDEYLLAKTSSSYLNIGQIFWTITPYSTSRAWRVRNNGTANFYDVTSANGVRPVINVRSDATITAGDGSAQLFYVLGEDKTTSITGILSEKVTSGEYVSLEGHTYRVVSKDSDGVKLILDGFYEETEGTSYTMAYGSNNTFTLDSGIGQKLNGDVLTWLGLSDSDKIITTTYYQGDGFGGTGTAYTDTLKQSNGVEVKVGLIQVGDILAGQSSTMLTNDYTTTSSYSNTTNYWTMNKYTSTSRAWYVTNFGYAGNNDVTNAYGVRPVIKVSTSLTISGGNGTWTSPYQI